MDTSETMYIVQDFYDYLRLRLLAYFAEICSFSGVKSKHGRKKWDIMKSGTRGEAAKKI